jgi:hypothetical protein
MFPHLRTFQNPWPFFTCQDAFDAERCAVLEAMFDGPWTWEQHRTFYEAAIAVVSDQVESSWLDALGERIAQITGMPLAGNVGVTLQIMSPGQFAAVHTDRPLLGYETFRVVLQLNRDWEPGHGGVFQVYASPHSDPVAEHPPRFNTAIGFGLHNASHHAVTATTAQRRSVVFHFTHAGNTQELAAAVADLFRDMDFGQLPAQLNPLMAHADDLYSEQRTFRAAAAGWALWRWGCEPSLIQAGFEAALEDELSLAADTSVLLACWVSRLQFEEADMALWARIQTELASRPAVLEPAQTLRRSAFPAHPRYQTLTTFVPDK